MPRSSKKEKGKGKLLPRGVETILKSVEEMKSTVGEIMEVTKHSRLPLGVKKAILECFKCIICLNLARSPIVITKCCKSILGCSSCVNTLYSGADALTKACPLCRTERGYNDTMVLNGLDSFLSTVSKIEYGAGVVAAASES